MTVADSSNYSQLCLKPASNLPASTISVSLRARVVLEAAECPQEPHESVQKLDGFRCFFQASGALGSSGHVRCSSTFLDRSVHLQALRLRSDAPPFLQASDARRSRCRSGRQLPKNLSWRTCRSLLPQPPVLISGGPAPSRLTKARLHVANTIRKAVR